MMEQKFDEQYDSNHFSQVLILMGCKGSGKTTLGKMLAENFNSDFFDTDDKIKELTGFTPRQIYTNNGAAEFMQAEENACIQIVKEIRDKGLQSNERTCKNANIVIATGGGICDNPPALNVFRDLPSAIFIHIKHSVKYLVEKQMNVDGEYPAYIMEKNPANDDEVRELFIKRFSRRNEQYDVISDLIIEMKNASAKDNLKSILEAL